MSTTQSRSGTASRVRIIAPALLLMLAAPLMAQVSGVVLDEATLAPIPDARVTLQTTTVRTTTAFDGTFSLPSVSGSGLVIVAGAKGFYNEGVTVTTPSSGLVIMMESVPVGDNGSYSFLDPDTCGFCHPDQFAQWAGSPMALAGTNTWTYDIYDGTGSPSGMGGFVYTLNSSHYASNPEADCASCHQPEPWVQQPHSALEPLGSLSLGAFHGVSCEACHKIAHVDETKVNFPGIYPGVVTFNRPDEPSTHQVEYGGLGDASFEAPSFMRPSFQPQLDAAVCGVCHQDKNDPDENGNFQEPNGVISEPTYLEWLASPYANEGSPQYADCVDCHMPAFGATQFCSFGPGGRDPETIRSHAILGTTPEYLENAVDLTLNAQQSGTDLQVTAAVSNTHAGHHVPTGVTVRNMVLLVQAWTVDDAVPLAFTGTQVVDDLGGVGDPAQGYYAGLPGKLYAKKNHDAAGNGPTFFTDATGILWDNRIPALATHVTNYVFHVPPGSGAVMVRARLVYRRAFRLLVDAKQWVTDGHGNPLEDVAPPYFGHLMEKAVWSSGGPGPVATFGPTPCNALVAGWQGHPFLGAQDFSLTLAGALPNANALLLGGLSDSSWMGFALPLDMSYYGAPGCNLLVAPDAFAPATTDAGGHALMAFPLPWAPPLVGLRGYFQWAVNDYANILGWSFSRGLEITLQP